MGSLTQESSAERAARVKTLNDALIEWVMKVAQGRVGQFSTAVPGLDISVRDERNASERCVYRRSLGVMLSGRKRSIVGNRVYEYGAGDMLYTLVDMPAMWQVVGATKEHPFIAVSIALDEEEQEPDSQLTIKDLSDDEPEPAAPTEEEDDELGSSSSHSGRRLRRRRRQSKNSDED